MATSSTRKSKISECLVHVDLAEISPGYRTCVICYEAFNNLESAVEAKNDHEQPAKLRCQHIFCKACITTWLQENDSCPTCRSVILPLQEPPAEDTFENTLDASRWWRIAKAEDMQRLRDSGRDPEGRLARFLNEHFGLNEFMSVARAGTWQRLINQVRPYQAIASFSISSSAPEDVACLQTISVTWRKAECFHETGNADFCLIA